MCVLYEFEQDSIAVFGSDNFSEILEAFVNLLALSMRFEGV